MTGAGMLWPLLFGVIMAAMTLPTLSQQSFDDASYMIGDTGGSEETENQIYEEVSKRALLALSRFKPFASAFTRSPALVFPETHRSPGEEIVMAFQPQTPSLSRYVARSFLTGMDGSRMMKPETRGRPLQNPMRYGR